MLAKRKQDLYRLADARPRHGHRRPVIGDGDLNPVAVPQKESDLGLKKVRSALHSVLDDAPERFVRKALKPAAHVMHAGAEHQVAENRATLADQPAGELPVEPPATHEAAARRKSVAPFHRGDELRNLFRKMTEPPIHLQDPPASRGQRLAVPAE